MKRSHVEKPMLPNDWSNVIENVQEVLTQTAKSAAERERRLLHEGPSVQKRKKGMAWNESLEHFEERLQLFQSAVQKAEDDAELADAALADAEKALQQWLARATNMTRKLREVQGVSDSSRAPNL